MIISINVKYKGKLISLGSLDMYMTKEECPFWKKYVMDLMQRGVDFGLEDMSPNVASVKEDLFMQDLDRRLLREYIKDNAEGIIKAMGWEKLGWISEFQDMIETIDINKVTDGFFIVYKAVRGELPENFPNSLKYSSVLSKAWDILRTDLRNDIIYSWLEENWKEANAYLSKMKIPPSFKEDHYIGVTYRELFRTYSYILGEMKKDKHEERRGRSGKTEKDDQSNDESP